MRTKYPDFASYYVHTDLTIALGMLGSFNELKKRWEAKKKRPEVNGLNTIMLDDHHLFKIVGDALRLNVGGACLWLPLKPTSKANIEGCHTRISLTKRGDKWLLNVVYRNESKIVKSDGILAYDVNGKSLDVLIAKDNLRYIHIDLSEVEHIHYRYQKRGKLQKLGLRKLSAKYKGSKGQALASYSIEVCG